MVYTRSSSTATHATHAAARTLITLKAHVPSGPSVSQFWSNWTAWYHAFVSEVKDERSLSGTQRMAEAERRWALSCAKQLRCDMKYVVSWLKHSDAKTRLTIAGF